MTGKTTQTRASIEALRAIRTQFGPEAAGKRLLALKKLKANFVPPSGMLIELHELLLFIRTYPDNRQVLEASESCLQLLVRHLSGIRKKHPGWFKRTFINSGVAKSCVQHAPSVDIALWLTSLFGSDLKDVPDRELAGRLGPVISLFTSKAEQNGLEHEGYDAGDWLNMAKGRQPTLVSWLARRAADTVPDAYIRDYLFETVQSELEWTLNDVSASRTGNIVPGKVAFQKQAFLKPVSNWMTETLPAPKRVGGVRSKQLLDSMRAVLAVRSRETDPVTYASRVYEATPYEGLSVFLTEMQPERKLPMENYTGYVAYRNGVPVAYGGGWMFGTRCEFGINIFETFRGGENARLFAGLLNVYRNLCNATSIVVQPYQFGADNDEGLKSGAFWFYYRMGFRPMHRATAQLAAAEYEKLITGKSRKTPLSVLRKFAEYPVQLKLASETAHIEPKEVSIAITKKIARQFNGNTQEANKWSLEQTCRILQISRTPSARSLAFEGIRNWAPVIAWMPGTLTWTVTQRQQVREMLYAKYTDEMLFSRLFSENHFFRNGLVALANEGRSR